MYKEIYDAMFTLDSYNMSDIESELRFQIPLNYIKQNNIKNIIDIGSGRGLLLKEIIDKNNDVKITSVDLTKYNSLNVNFVEADITKKCDRDLIEDKYELLICTDCLEHIKKEQLEEIIEWFSLISKNAIITVANHNEWFVINGTPVNLHVTRESDVFWKNILQKYFNITDFLNKEDIWYFFTLESKNEVQ